MLPDIESYKTTYQLLQHIFDDFIKNTFEKYRLDPNNFDILEHSLLLMAGITTYPGKCNFDSKDTNIIINFKLSQEDLNQFTGYIRQQGAEISYLRNDETDRQMVQTTTTAILNILPMIDSVLNQISQLDIKPLPIYKILFEQKQYEAAWYLLSSAWQEIRLYPLKTPHSHLSPSTPFPLPHLFSPITSGFWGGQPSTFNSSSKNRGESISPDAIAIIEQNFDLQSGTILAINYTSQNTLEIYCPDEIGVALVLSVLNLKQEPEIDTISNKVTIQGTEAEKLFESLKQTPADLTQAVELRNC